MSDSEGKLLRSICNLVPAVSSRTPFDQDAEIRRLRLVFLERRCIRLEQENRLLKRELQAIQKEDDE